MRVCSLTLILLMACLIVPMAGEDSPHGGKPVRHNIVIFVADGLRHESVTPTDTPTLWRIREEGVHFANSHSLFPTFTTANASAIATGHYLGDTGDFSNVIWTKYLLFTGNNFGRNDGFTVTPFLEDDQVIGDLNDHYNGNYLQEMTLFAAARKAGYRTAAVGKLGPAAIQDAEELTPRDHEFAIPKGVLLDDSTGKFNPKTPKPHNAAPPLPQEIADAFLKAGVSLVPPDRSNGCDKNDPCNNGSLHTSAANWAQQQYMVDGVTQEILPALTAGGEPFLLVFWSRDPDGTQHNQGDKTGDLTPGINGRTSKKALKNCDDNLRQIVDYLRDNNLEATTDLIVTSDHGFATISRSEINAQGDKTKSEALQDGTLPNGFLAIDIARHLGFSLFDPDKPNPPGSSGSAFHRIDLAQGDLLSRGNALLGLELHSTDGADAKAIVAANGGSDLIYVPSGDKETVQNIIEFLVTCDYVGGIFVDDTLGQFKGTLPMSAIGLVGKTPLPRPSIVVTFKVFYLKPGDLQSAVQISDTFLQKGQGMHGGFGRDSTFNNMAAIGPDFKRGFTDDAPVSNADIAPTLAEIIGVKLTPAGSLQGRVMAEAFVRNDRKVSFERAVLASEELAGRRTILEYQKADDRLYFDRACFVKTSKKQRLKCEPD